MRSPASAIAWQLWARYRWWFVAGVVYFVVLATLCHVMPQGAVLKAVRFYLALPVMAAPIGLFIVFVFGADADVASKDSVFPERMFTLPLRARSLVGWPMLCGAVAMVVVCVAIGQLALRTVWPQFPLWWPALLAAGCLAWLQALAWSPFGLPWLRLGSAVAVLGALIAVPSVAPVAKLPEVALVIVLAVQIPAAYAVAVWGVRCARRGDSPDWHWLVGRMRRARVERFVRGRDFRSARHAQLWLEWRMHGLSLPFMVGLGLPLFVALILIKTVGPRVHEASVFLHPVVLFLLPWYVAMTAGPIFGTFTARPGKSGVCSFLATRPMDCAGFVRVKFKMALVGVLAAYALVTPVAVIMTVALKKYHMLSTLANRLGASSSPVETLAIGLVAFLLLIAVCWKLVVDRMFTGLIGRNWMVVAMGAFWLFAFFGLFFLGWWIYMHPEYLDTLTVSVPYLLGLLAALKLVLAGWVFRAIHRRKLLDGKAIARLVGLWLAVAAGLLGLAAWLVPRGVLPWHVAAFGALLTVPLVRIGLAPLALAWNRHR